MSALDDLWNGYEPGLHRADLRAQRRRGALRLTTMIPAARSRSVVALWPLFASGAVAALFAAWVWWLT